MRAVVAALLLATAWLAEPRAAVALSVQEAILRAKPAVALITAEVKADVTMNCGQGLVTVSPAPFVETGTGWFVDGRGFLITNAHVIDPPHRLPPWVTHELKKKAIEQACVEPVLGARGLMRGQRPDVEEQIRRQASDVALATAKVAPHPKITVMLSNGTKLPAEVRKFSPPLLLDRNNKAVPDSGRDLALLRVKDVAKFLQGTEVTKPGESAFNPVWTAGIEALLDGRYLAAVAKFQEANTLLPGLTDVKRLLAEAEEKVRNPPPRPFPWAWATLGVTLLSLGAYGGMWGRRWWKNRFRIQPTQVIAFIERGLNPVLLDVRTKTDYETSPLKLPGAVRLEPESAPTANLGLEPGQLIVLYCTSPEEATSARVIQVLRARGFKSVRILKGGLGGWTNARLPVEAKSSLPSIGLEIYKNLSLGDIERRRFRAGEVIFREGDDPRGEAYVIHAGTVEIKRRLDGAERTLNRLGEGELLGDLALFRKGPRSASAVATAETELLVIKDERLEWLIRNRPQLTVELLKRLSKLVVATY